MSVADVTTAVKASPVVALALLVWYEVHQMRQSIEGLNAAIAVLVDRADHCSAP